VVCVLSNLILSYIDEDESSPSIEHGLPISKLFPLPSLCEERFLSTRLMEDTCDEKQNQEFYIKNKYEDEGDRRSSELLNINESGIPTYKLRN
jgi:hypothetical protein